MTEATRGIVLGVVLASAACGTTPTARERPPRPVVVTTAGRYVQQTTLRYSATVEPYVQTTLAFKVSGYVAELLQQRGADGRLRSVQAGDLVPRGAVLARIREQDYREAANQAEAQLAEAQSALVKATQDHQRINTLFERASATQPELDAATAQLDSARARAVGARAAVAQRALTLADVTLAAPDDGVLLARNVELGSLAAPGQTAFTIAEVRRVKVVFGVPDTLVRRIAAGTKLSLTAEAMGRGQYEGTVTTVSPQADPQSRLFSIELTVANPQNELRPGMVAAVTVPGDGSQTREAPLVVPLASIVKAADSGYAVYVVERAAAGEMAHYRKVALGDVLGNAIVVREGLREGERVIVAGATLVRDGEAVRIVPGAE
jgi:RND family efflux transporter MFP subunit